MKTLKKFSLLIYLMAALAIFCPAQDSGSLENILTEEELLLLSRENDVKDQLELMLKFSTVRLNNARLSVQQEQYEMAVLQVRDYSLLCKRVADHTEQKIKKDGDKKRLFKKLEQRLRIDLGTLNVFRYELPQKYTDEMEPSMNLLNRTRDRALSGIFGKGFFSEHQEE